MSPFGAQQEGPLETLTMSMKERRRLAILGRVESGELTVGEAARICSLSKRQMQRIRSRHESEGDIGLVHRSRGKPSNRARPAGQKKAVLELYEKKYEGFGPTLASEYLAADGHSVNEETLRRWLIAAKLWHAKPRKQRHRSRRPRRACRGELIQMGGSFHDWFEGRRDWAVLMVMIDDADGRLYARFYEAEATETAMDIFERYVRSRGLPQALYVDHHSIYHCTREANISRLRCAHRKWPVTRG